MQRHPYCNPHPDCQARHLTQRELADCWHKSEATLERYRCEGNGPRFLKIGGAVRYRLEDIEAFERGHLYDSPHSRVSSQRDLDSRQAAVDSTWPGEAA